MPYRRFPKTDKARVRSLNDALFKAMDVGLNDLAFSQVLLSEIRSFLPSYINDLQQYQQKLELQNNGAAKYRAKEKYARMYISHFLQIVFMSEMRGEMKPEHKLFYGLEKDTTRLPDLSTEDAVEYWGNKVVEGEKLRIQKGGTPIYTPSIAKVQVRVEVFTESYGDQKFLRKRIGDLNTKILGHRERADNILSVLWNEIEGTFEEIEDPAERLKSCQSYGIIYYYRKGETKLV